MKIAALTAVAAIFAAGAALAQERVGSLILTLDGEERTFALVQGGGGTNPGSRYSRLGEDVNMTIVGVLGDTPRAPEEAQATVELRFTVDGTGEEVRTGSVLSYSTRDAEGNPAMRGGTVEIALVSLDSGEDAVSASGTFTAQLTPDADSSGGEVEGSFDASIMSRDAPDS